MEGLPVRRLAALPE